MKKVGNNDLRLHMHTHPATIPQNDNAPANY